MRGLHDEILRMTQPLDGHAFVDAWRAHLLARRTEPLMDRPSSSLTPLRGLRADSGTCAGRCGCHFWTQKMSSVGTTSLIFTNLKQKFKLQ